MNWNHLVVVLQNWAWTANTPTALAKAVQRHLQFCSGLLVGLAPSLNSQFQLQYLQTVFPTSVVSTYVWGFPAHSQLKTNKADYLRAHTPYATGQSVFRVSLPRGVKCSQLCCSYSTPAIRPVHVRANSSFPCYILSFLQRSIIFPP